MQKQILEEQNNDIKAMVLVEVQNVVMHRLLNKEKTLFTSGTCKVAAIENNKGGPVYFINLGSFYYGINSLTFFIKAQYADSISYIFPHFDNGLSAISFQKANDQITLIDETLAASAPVYQVEDALTHEQVQKLIDSHYPNIKEQIYYPDNIKKVISLSGKYINQAFNYIGAALQTGVSTVGNYINQNIAQNQQNNEIQPQTKEKWQKIKLKATNFMKISSEFANGLLTPVITKTKEITSEINQKIQHSDNKSVKYAREIVQASGKAFEEAVGGLLKGGAQVTKEFGEQGKKLIAKKYGQQMMKVIVDPVEGQILQKKEVLESALQRDQIKKIQGQNIKVEYPNLKSDS